MPFWTATSTGKGQDPKRVSRFKVSIGALNNEDVVWYAKSFTKPSAEIKTIQHRYLNHTFNYPGSVTWSDVTIELVDPTDPIDAAGSLAQILVAMGYQVPASPAATGFVNISKRKSVATLGLVSVSQINDEGTDIETWTLKQAIATKIEWGAYKYDGDDLNVLKLTLKYDWAECQLASAPGTDATAKSVVLSTTATTPTTPFFKAV